MHCKADAVSRRASRSSSRDSWPSHRKQDPRNIPLMSIIVVCVQETSSQNDLFAFRVFMTKNEGRLAGMLVLVKRAFVRTLCKANQTQSELGPMHSFMHLLMHDENTKADHTHSQDYDLVFDCFCELVKSRAREHASL